MPPQPTTVQTLRAENAELRARLEEAEEMLHAIRAGEVDALVVEGDAGPQLFTLQGLDAEQNRLRGEMLAQVSDAVIAVDTEERVTFLNAAAERQYGVRAGEVLGRRLTEIFTPQWPGPGAEAGMRTALSKRGEWRGELIHRTRDGRELHVEKAVSTLHGPHGVGTGRVAAIRDISGRKDAERELRESEARLRSILTQSPAGILETDAAGRMKLVNDHWCHMLGYTEAEMLGKTVLDLTHPSCIAATTEAVGRLAAGGPDFQIEKFYCRKDGTRLSAQSNVTALRAPSGEFLGLIAVVLDITDRLRIESELRDRTHFLERIAQVTPGVLQVFDLVEKRNVFINRTLESLLGYSAEEVHAMGAEVVRCLMHPDDLPGSEEHIARVRSLADGEVAAFEFRMRDRAGGWRWFHSHDAVFARDATGAVWQFIGVSTEITGRKLAEEVTARLAAIVECSYDALLSEDLDGIVTSWNRGAEQIFGYGAEEIIGTSILRLIPDAGHAAEHELQRKIVTGKRGGTFEATRQAKDGREFHASITVSPMRDAAGKIIGTSRVIRDITERKLAADRLREAKEAAEAANRSKDRFLAALSHELRTPLTPVLLVSEVHAKSEKLSEDLREDFEMIHRNIVLEAQLIDDLLDVSRIQQGKMRFDLKIVDVHEAIALALEMLHSEVEEKGIAVRQVPGAAPATVEADPARLRQVLCNLLRNAVKFTPRGGTISVHTARDQSALQISITDTGAGIAAEDLERIFQPFEQVGAQQKSEHVSLGLGLAISAAIISAHRGRIWAESPGPSQGATLHVWLPG
jgi:PAS domain S-box-containing protein